MLHYLTEHRSRSLTLLIEFVFKLHRLSVCQRNVRGERNQHTLLRGWIAE
jgi:hypothetical protein